MGKRQKKWARDKRDELFVLLGGKCVDCGSTEELEFDVVLAAYGDRHHNKMDWSWRMSFYRKMFDLGNLALRCKRCNVKKGNDLHLNPTLVDEGPF